MGNKKIRERSEIDKKYKWNIEAMYSSPDQWEKDVALAASKADDFCQYQGHLAESASTLCQALIDRDEIWETVERAFVYARMKLDEDNRSASQQAMYDKINSIIAAVSAKMSFVTPEILSHDEEKILGYVDDYSPLSQYRFMLKNTLREKKHVLSKDEENLLAQLSEVNGATNTIFTMLNNADMNFGTIKSEDGEDVELTHGNYIKFMQSHDRTVRRSAYEAVYNTYKGLINTIATTYSYNVKTDVVYSKIRHYSSSRMASLSGNNIPESVYDNLITVVNENLPALHRYTELRKRILGVDKLKMYDIYVPLVKLPKRDVTFEEAVEIMGKALAPLGDDYVKTVSEGVSNRWIDVFETPGKTSGAYSFGSYDSAPYILLNYGNTLQDVFTVVHEMGHSMHSYYTRSNQPFIYGDHSIFTAEVASTVNEALLMHYLLHTEKDPDMRKYLINMHIEEFRTTLFRQTMFAEFEKLTHQYVEEGGSLTAQWMNQQYDQLNRKYFGSALDDDDLICYEWSRIPHFYRAFYVYQYATGYSAATAISNKILTEGSSARDAYREFLKTGSSNYPVELLKIAGVDMSQKEPVVLAMETFKNLVEELEELL